MIHESCGNGNRKFLCMNNDFHQSVSTLSKVKLVKEPWVFPACFAGHMHDLFIYFFF